jgi:II/X family phage/plasmid replication protein
MLDTAKVTSPFLAEDVAGRIEGQLKLRQAVDLSTGEIDYAFIAGDLVGSYDHRISLRVMRERWESRRVRLPDGRRINATTLHPSPPYLSAEGSVHKAMLGHNVTGGPCDVRAALRWFVAFIAGAVGEALPGADYWQVRRLDWAEAFDLGTFAAVEEWLRSVNGAAYPRRKPVKHGSESITFPGYSTTIKAYHKGPEFRAHDGRRLRGSTLTDDALEGLQQASNSVLRVEVGIKARKLDADHGSKPPLVGQISETYCADLYDRETARMLREGRSDMETVRTLELVEERLFALHSAPLASALVSTWVRLSTMGEDHARRRLSVRTFYRHRRLLQDAAISWHGTDVVLLDPFTHIPAGFSPLRSDPRRMVGEAPPVLRLLAPYRDEMAAD